MSLLQDMSPKGAESKKTQIWPKMAKNGWDKFFRPWDTASYIILSWSSTRKPPQKNLSHPVNTQCCSLARVLSSRCLWWCEWCQDYLCIGASHGQHWQTIARRPATEITPCVFLPFRLIWPSHSRPTDLKYQTKDRGMFSTRHSTLDSLHSKPPHMVGTILELILRRYIDCIESWR